MTSDSDSPLRRLFAAKSSGLIIDQRTFRYATECERLRIYRNGSTLAVLLLRPETVCDAATSAIESVLQDLLSPIDTAGYCHDSRVGVLLPDYSFDQATQLADRMSAECAQLGHPISLEIMMYPDQPLRDAIEGQSDPGVAEPETVQLAHGLSESGAFFALPVPWWKRAVDIVAGGTALVLTMPILLLGVALVKATSNGTVFFTQQRTGHGGRPFTLFKIRTMRMGADKMVDSLRHRSEQDGPAFKLKNDPRTLPVGRLLRKLSIDELPQLWNVIKGDMSLVGPRPLPTSESAELALWQRERLDALPGITGPWQVSGRNNIGFDDWMRLDINYVRTLSFWQDLKILLCTIPAVLFCRGAS